MLLGTNDDGEKFYLELEYENKSRTCLNISHEPITYYTRISFRGALVSKYGSLAYDRGIRSLGQNRDELLKITNPANGHTLKSIREIHALWVKYHLNDMESHCIHQDQAIKWDEVDPCLITGYKAGSNWLVNEISGQELDRIVATVTHRELMKASA